MSVLNILFSILNLDRSAPPVPFKKTPAGTPQRKRADTPPNIVHYAGRPFVQKEDTENRIFEDTLYIGQGQRTAEVTNKDLEIVREKNLDETKYRELKALWASGISAMKAARKYQNRRGYSVRTLDDYWRAFSLAFSLETTPLPI